MDTVFLTNTLTGKKESFDSLVSGKVSMYCCGPTVYDYAHIGNFRSFLMADVLTRTLKYAGYQITKVQNITDVGHLTQDDLADSTGEDKIAKKALAEKKDPYEIARYYEDAFIEDEAVLNIIPPDHRPRATDFIQEQIDIAVSLIDSGHAYESNGSVYFRVNSFPTYGQLSKNKLEDLIAGARIEPNSEKENPMDFALWKKAEPEHLMQWDSPWGRGFPGWHIECSAMSRAYLGDHFDIHTGGEDNIFPHHECEIAQNECSCGGKKSVNYWLHAKHLLVDGEKMSKSKGNFFTIRDLLDKGWTGSEIRYLLISAHYRTALNFTMDGLQMARSSIDRIAEAHRVFSQLKEGSASDFANSYREDYKKSLFDDINASDALGAVFALIKAGNKAKEQGTLTSQDAMAIVEFLENDFESIFAVLPQHSELSSEQIQNIEMLIEKRQSARENKDWATSDQIRDELLQMGIELIDQGGKTTWKHK